MALRVHKSSQQKIRDPSLMADTNPNPNRNSSGNRRASGDQTSNQQNNDGERNQPLARRIITQRNCSSSEAYQLLSKRWKAEMDLYNDPTLNSSERPIMYHEESVWGKLPHQILAAANNTLPPKPILPMEYITELRQKILGKGD